MNQVYEGHGIRFEYPEGWDLKEEDSDESHSVTVSSPETCFWCISLFADAPPPPDVLESAVEAFREEYEEVDVYDPANRPDDPAIAACDMDFVCFELINSAFLRCFAADHVTVLVLYQGFDQELAGVAGELEAISASLTVNGRQPLMQAPRRGRRG